MIRRICSLGTMLIEETLVLRCAVPLYPPLFFLASCFWGVVSLVPVRAQDLVPEEDNTPTRQPRMSTPHRVLYIQTRMCVPFSHLPQWLKADLRIGLHKYSPEVYEACIESFCALPVAALVDGKFFCVHGGISPALVTLKDLERVRFAAFIPPDKLQMQRG